MIDVDSTVRETVRGSGPHSRSVLELAGRACSGDHQPDPHREVTSAVAASSVIPSKTSPAASAKIGFKWSKAQAVVEAIRVGDAPDGAQVLDRAV
jgi:hypothetical protein